MRVAWKLPPRYIGPPDPLSNLRPVVFGVSENGGENSSEKHIPPRTSHPYSLTEFSLPATRNSQGVLAQYVYRCFDRLEAAQLQTRLQTMWLDQFNQRFWIDNNTRFQRARQEYEAALNLEVEHASLEQVAPFYRAWLATNAARLRNYNHALWAGTARVIAAQTHYRLLRYYTQFVARLAGIR
ncbi:hypothetical protein MPSI1_002391 [Malassezia psittaci]|uniref:Uncharacterized protein n=1 Tax=Malassezia psittaci TaxID=1821823 RepID=A0AAF0FAI9_9BASI|nr:hypothetical protein MPSI1_002391 [Malassezia psittaci]